MKGQVNQSQELSTPPSEIVKTASLSDRVDAARREFGAFPELTEDENHMVLIARAKGYAKFWPAYPSALVQARSTFTNAQVWLQNAPDNCQGCAVGEVHGHPQAA